MTAVLFTPRFRWTWTIHLNGVVTDDVYYDFEAARKAAKRFRVRLGYKRVEVYAHFDGDRNGPPISVVWDRKVDGHYFTRAGVPRHNRTVRLTRIYEQKTGEK